MHCFLIFLLSLLAIKTIAAADGCLQVERDALLEFKAGVNDPFHRLASWRGEDCCAWAGIKCSNQTGHVIKLNLANPYGWSNNSLSGEISPSLLALTDLKHLDLSKNNFSGSPFPKFSCSFKKLEYLDLSSMGLSGMIPSQISNLSRLQYLNLYNLEEFDSISSVTFVWYSQNYVADIWWFSHLTSLKYLNISGVNLQESREWVQALNMLPSLENLILEWNNLTTIPTSLPIVNFSSLTTFFLGDQNFNAPIPVWMGQLTSLTNLKLENCLFTGSIPNLHNLHNLTNLRLQNVNINEDISELVSKFSSAAMKKFESLILSNNRLTGNLTGWLDKMPNLNCFWVNYNKLNGTIPTEIGKLSKLVTLDLCQNSFTGEISEAHLTGLSNLMFLSLSCGSIKVAGNWTPVFQLKILRIINCNLGPKFPSWLQNQTQLSVLNLTNTYIDDTLPDWFGNFSNLKFIDMSHNHIKGKLPLSFEHFTQLTYLTLKYNQFSGAIFPSLPHSLYALDLSYNSFSGPLPLRFQGPSLVILILSNNNFNGSIGESICGLTSLSIFSLSGNNISGNLPHCWPKMLRVIDLAKNKLSGVIPSSISLLKMLSVLQLHNNSLTGELPSSLQFCINLFALDLGQNKFYGQIPEWIGDKFSSLTKLRLRSNSFSGNIPTNIIYLRNLQVLDLANNNIAGSIPQNLNNLEGMVSTDNIPSSILQLDSTDSSFYSFSLSVVMKSLDLEYSTTPLSSLRSIDLSENDLIGEIPESITALIGLTNLNLSYNHFSGKIPMDIGKMHLIESLDLRMNNFSGLIPYSLATMNFLTTLNLSFNNLSGNIPTGNQLQTINNPYMYIGNDYLCGPPLNKSCNNEIVNHVFSTTNNSGLEEVFFYIFVALGFVFGFWAFFGVLIFKRNWRYCFFQMVDDMFDRICVFVMLYFARLWRNKAT